jgi:hypothetical protein
MILVEAVQGKLGSIARLCNELAEGKYPLC